MRIAVIGGTGLAGRHTVEALRRAGHEPVAVARATGVDVLTGEGLDDALEGVEAVVDAGNHFADEPAEAIALFGAATEILLAAEQRAGVRHHVLLSILGLDRIEGNAHYAGKRRQEGLMAESPVAATIVRAAQFHEFAETVVARTRRGGEAAVAPLLMQPVAAADVGAVLAEVAAGPALGRAPDLAGPQPEDLVDMARRVMAAKGDPIRLLPSWRGGVFGPEAAGEVLLPAPGARLAATTFDAWLGARFPGP
jgi:uncharacterized protein YbjT (DUF2867 family)